MLFASTTAGTKAFLNVYPVERSRRVRFGSSAVGRPRFHVRLISALIVGRPDLRHIRSPSAQVRP